MSKKVPHRILVVDDDEDILITARIVLKQRFQHIATESNPHQIEARLKQASFDLVLLDMNFTVGFTSGKEGLRWLKKIRKQFPQTRVVLMTAYGDISLAVKAMKEGASDFVVKPWDNDELLATVLAASQEEPASPSAALAPAAPAAATRSQSSGPLIIGKSQAMQKVFGLIEKVATTDANILILGENGTGKEVIARELHRQSKRAPQSFVHVDLGAISESLFESELFGHVKGAFTDAREDRAGRFEAANKGTLFLDEIGNLSLPLQAKLLSALQSRQINRVGSNKVIPIDIRLICATNMPLYEMVQEKGFRQDLIYRINTVELTLPALRERPSDIPLLVRHFMEIYANKYQREALELSPATLQRLQQYAWPGNVRELQHAVERAVIMGDSEILSGPVGSPTTPTPENQAFKLEEIEKTTIINAINKHDGNISKAAKELGLGRTTLYRKMNKYGL